MMPHVALRVPCGSWAEIVAGAYFSSLCPSLEKP